MVAHPPLLIEVASRIREAYFEAVKDLGPGLAGHSVLDLMADTFPSLPLRTLEDAIVIAGLGKEA